MRKLNKKTKIIIIVFALLFSLVVCEVFLHISSFVNKVFVLPRYDIPGIDKKAFIIFCFGDSYTYGIGAGFENSYPAQLEEILNRHSKGRPVKVFNFGVPGNNSSQVLLRLKQNIAKNKPNVVIVLCGGNDTWNVDSVNIKFTNEIIQALLMRLKIYKILVVLTKNIKHQISKPEIYIKDNLGMKILQKENDFYKLILYGNIYRNFEYYTQAVLFYERAIKVSQDDRLVRIELGRCYKLNRQFRKAIDVLDRALKDNPQDEQLHAEIRDTFIKSEMVDESILFYEEFLEKCPRNKYATDNLIGAYIQAAGENFLNNQALEGKSYYKKALALNPQLGAKINASIEMMEYELKLKDSHSKLNAKPSTGSFLKSISGDYLINTMLAKRMTLQILFENLLEMAKICKKNNIKMFLSCYPDAGYMDNVSIEIRKLALAYDVTIINHYNAFFDALRKYPYEHYFVSRADPHCTKAGYRVMAENIAQAILDKFCF